MYIAKHGYTVKTEVSTGHQNVPTLAIMVSVLGYFGVQETLQFLPEFIQLLF